MLPVENKLKEDLKMSLSSELAVLCTLARSPITSSRAQDAANNIISKYPELSGLVLKLLATSSTSDLHARRTIPSSRESISASRHTRHADKIGLSDYPLSSVSIILPILSDSDAHEYLNSCTVPQIITFIDYHYSMGNAQAIKAFREILCTVDAPSDSVFHDGISAASLYIDCLLLFFSSDPSITDLIKYHDLTPNHQTLLFLITQGANYADLIIQYLDICIKALPTHGNRNDWNLPSTVAYIDRFSINVTTGEIRIAGWASDLKSRLSNMAIIIDNTVAAFIPSCLISRCYREDLEEYPFDQSNITKYHEVAGFIATSILSIASTNAIRAEGDYSKSASIVLGFANGSTKVLSGIPLEACNATNESATHHFRQAVNAIIDNTLDLRFPPLHYVLSSNWGAYIKSKLSDLRIKVLSKPALNKLPDASVIIPIYGNLDLMRLQLQAIGSMQAKADSGINFEVEFIFVCDDPRLAQDFQNLSQAGKDCYGATFCAIDYNQNLGYSCANNIGASYAGADTLICQNSDVFINPSAMRKVYADLCETLAMDEKVGIVGCELMFSDNTIQHIGMESVIFPGKQGLLGKVALNHHPMKCQPNEIQATVDYTPSLVTGAFCAMRIDDFKKIDGFSTSYIIGDFEDSDLCYKIKQNGLEVRLLRPSAQVVHLERQSYILGDPDIQKLKLVAFNACTHWLNHASSIIQFSQASS
jgi:GT2 family glycosyltransferase